MNKEADRAVMVETIRRALRAFDFKEQDYRYVSLGGPFLEDLKRIHGAFPKMALCSIEEDVDTYKRQEFHRFLNDKHLELRHEKAHGFIRQTYEPQGKEIVWLDLLDFKLPEVNDFAYLATQLPAGSLLRMTVRAEWNEKLPGVTDTAAWEAIFKRFQSRFGDLAPDRLEADDFLDGTRYCSLINNIIVGAAQDELAPPLPRYFQPLTSLFYRDETRMFSVMGIILNRPKPKEQREFKGVICDSRIVQAFKDWDLASLDGKQVHVLDLPSLSEKERLAIQRHMPLSNGARRRGCLKELPYLIGSNKGDHERRLLRYAALASYYAQFARVAST